MILTYNQALNHLNGILALIKKADCNCPCVTSYVKSVDLDVVSKVRGNYISSVEDLANLATVQHVCCLAVEEYLVGTRYG